MSVLFCALGRPVAEQYPGTAPLRFQRIVSCAKWRIDQLPEGKVPGPSKKASVNIAVQDAINECSECLRSMLIRDARR